MSQTINDIKVTSEAWVDLSNASGIPAGTEYDIQNKKGTWVLLHESDGEPSINETSGRVMPIIPDPSAKAIVVGGSLRIWAKALSSGAVTTATLNLQII